MSMMISPARFGSIAPAWQDGHYLFAMWVNDNPAKDSVSAGSGTNVGNAASDTTNKKIGFDGTGDWTTFPGGPAFDPTTNWTIEFHATFSGSVNNDGIVSRLSSGAGRYVICVNGTSGINVYMDNFSSGSPILTTGTNNSATMTHYALVRDSGTWRLYVGGVQVDSRVSAVAPSSSAADLYIGTDVFNTSRDLLGAVGRLLISDVARYPSGTTFSPPSITNAGEPYFAVNPSISGNAWVGQVLTCSPGTIIGGVGSPAYQWTIDGSNISGETASTYTQVSGDIGHTITCKVTATNAVGSTPVAAPGVFVTATDPAAAIRASRLLYVNGSSGVLTLPTGSLAGDLMVLYVGHGYSCTTPSGWTSRDNQAGSNFNGAVFTKVLASGDITTGSVTVSFAGSYFGIMIGVTFVGGTSGYRTMTATRNGSGASSRTVTTGGTPVAGDYALYFGGARVNAAVTSASGSTALQSNAQSEASSVARFGLVAASGAVSGVFNYAGSPSGDYQAVVVIAP